MGNTSSYFDSITSECCNCNVIKHVTVSICAKLKKEEKKMLQCNLCHVFRYAFVMLLERLQCYNVMSYATNQMKGGSISHDPSPALNSLLISNELVVKLHT